MAIVICVMCGLPHYKRPRDLSNKNQYCSRACYLSHKVRYATCQFCCSQFKVKSKRAEQKFCGRVCSNKARVGTTYKVGQPKSKVQQRTKNYMSVVGRDGEQCSWCGLGTVWEHKPLVLQVDHINGVRKDNRLENLRLLCPNCHSQTDTFGGRNIRKYKPSEDYRSLS